MEEYEAFDVLQPQHKAVSCQPRACKSVAAAEVLRMGFDKRTTSVDAVPCGDGSIFYCTALLYVSS